MTGRLAFASRRSRCAPASQPAHRKDNCLPDWTLQTLTLGPLQMNAYLVWSQSAGEAILVDPGDEPERLREAVAETGCHLGLLLCTHGHLDHIGAAAAVQELWDLPLHCHPEDRPLIDALPQIQTAYGFSPTTVPHLAPDLQHGLQLPFAGTVLEVRHVPGHSPGHVMFILGKDALVGDCIFRGSVGRTDLPGASFSQLARSIREQIYTLPDTTRLHPGHGPATSVGQEKMTNPFVNLRS